MASALPLPAHMVRVEYAAGASSLAGRVGNAPVFTVDGRMANLTSDPSGQRHCPSSRTSAQGVQHRRAVRLKRSAGCDEPAPTAAVDPADPVRPLYDPTPGSAPWQRLARLHDAAQTSSIHRPANPARAVAAVKVATPSPFGRSARTPDCPCSVEVSGRLLGGAPKTIAPRTRTFYPPIRQSGMLRVEVTAHVPGQLNPAVTNTYDIDLTLFETGRGEAFSRFMQVALFEKICGERGCHSSEPAPRGRFSPPIGSRAFFRAVADRGVSCHYRVSWPDNMDPLPRPPSSITGSSYSLSQSCSSTRAPASPSASEVQSSTPPSTSLGP